MSETKKKITDTPVVNTKEKSKMAMFLEKKKNELSGMNTTGKNGQSMSSGQRAFAKKNSRRSHLITKK